MRLRISKNSWKHRKSLGLDEITKIEVKLHRLIFSADHNYQQLRQYLGKMKIEEDKGKNYRKRHYEGMAYSWCNGKILSIFYCRRIPVLPKCIIEVSYPSKECLTRLNESLPHLNPSSVELTVDLDCSNPKAVPRLFKVLLKYCYVPRSSKLKFHRGHSPKHRQTPELNCTYYIGNMKIYERGADKTPGGQGWDRSELNMVRVEFKANRQVLRDNGINSLDDLLSILSFEKIFLPRLHFKVFRRSALLPKEIDTYGKLDEYESFQKQLTEAREQGVPNLNRNQCIVDAPGFTKLKKRIVRKIREFDRKWKK